MATLDDEARAMISRAKEDPVVEETMRLYSETASVMREMAAYNLAHRSISPDCIASDKSG